MEIERKFTIKALPEDLTQYVCKELEQGYLCNRPVVRVRKSVKNGEASYILCYKSKLGLEQKEDATAQVCREEEMPLTEEAYEKLLSKVDGRVITKKRYLIPYDSYTIELDVFAGELTGLVFAEVEFPDEEAAAAFALPDWFEKDVTFDDRFKNGWLARHEEAPEELRKAGIIKFGLMEYSEEFIDKIIGYRMRMDKDLNRYLSCEEIAAIEKCSAEDVWEILFRTSLVWNH